MRIQNSDYKDKNCLGCSSTPPIISTSIIRDLGATFCNINPYDLTDTKLHAKPSSSKPVGKKAGTKKPSQSSKKGGENKDGAQ